MLIYANSLQLQPTEGPSEVIQLTAKWLGRRAKTFVDEVRLGAGIRELVLKDGSVLFSKSSGGIGEDHAYPFLFSAQLSHRDPDVSGRRWITEIGVRQERPGAPVECSLLLKTEEVSAQVTTPVRATRPRLVEDLVRSCFPIAGTPGMAVRSLHEDNAEEFLEEVQREDRRHPLVLVSCNKDGVFPIAAERLGAILAGLADVVEIKPGADSFAIEDVVGRRNFAFGGAINIVFPLRRRGEHWLPDTVLMLPETIADLLRDGKALESEVLSAITHRTNLPASWRHISPSRVDQALRHRRVAVLLDRARKGDQSGELEEYIALLDGADAEIAQKDAEILQAQVDVETKNEEVRDLKAEVFNLQQTVAGLKGGAQVGVTGTNGKLRDMVADAIINRPTLLQVLELMAEMFPDRLVVLDNAFASARESDRGGFKLADKACGLLHTLATSYWQALHDGRGDHQAKAVFGQNAFSANEASTLSNDGKRARTFTYRGRQFLMERHLKAGVKDSKAETLRIHFEWLPDDELLVIGHCGKHLDF